jgi:hypothetical protein
LIGNLASVALKVVGDAASAQLGGVSIDEGYIYPANLFSAQESGSMSQDQVLRELFNLFNRAPGSVPVSKVILRDGSTFTGVPFSIQTDTHRPLVIQFVAVGELAPRVLGIDEIASIH